MTALTIALAPIISLTDEQYYQLCRNNPDVKFERNAQGDLVIMPPTGGGTGKRNFNLLGQLSVWVTQDGTGIGFDSSTGFKLPNGADRSPDAAWITLERWNTLTPEQQEKFPPICPDFVVELMSPGDQLSTVQAKMREYRDNGAQLGWLLNRGDRQVEIYRPNQPVEVLQSPTALSGEDMLFGFVLQLAAIW